MQQHTDASARAVLDELARLHGEWRAHDITKATYESACYHYGFNHDPDNLLLDDNLGVGLTSMMHDWVHIYVVSGVFNTELQFLLIYL